jgi:hypothetical protein
MGPEEAEALEQAGDWSGAGAAWLGLARGESGPRAAEHAGRAGDAFRRADRPADTVQAMRLALTHRPATVQDAVLLAGALIDCGEVNAALGVAASAADSAESDAARALALDVLAGSMLAAGMVTEARQPVAELAGFDLGGAQLAARFRQGQLARLDGDLRQALAQWHTLAALLRPHPAAAGALAATWSELGETMVLRRSLRGVPWFPDGEEEAVAVAEAEACFAQASAAWARVSRKAGYLRAEAWRARLRRGLPGTVDTALAYADERGLAGMSVEMRCLRSATLRRPEDALDAVRLARQTPLSRGRARVLAGELGAPLDLAVALQELRHDLPWRARAERLGSMVSS